MVNESSMIINRSHTIEMQYLGLLSELVEVYEDDSQDRQDRTGVGTSSVFARCVRGDLRDGFPLLTTKKLHWKSIITELLWFLRGETSVRWLNDRGVSIWDEWAGQDDELGPVYGAQWRSWRGSDGKEYDQLDNLVKELRHNPFSRRHLVSAWNVAQLADMKLPPCHLLFQCYVRETSKGRLLDLMMYQRSADIFLGVPFNIASYATLTHILAAMTDMIAGNLCIVFADLHLYNNHIKQAREQLSRKIKPMPALALKNVNWASKFDKLEEVNFNLEQYDPHPSINAPVAA